MGTARTGGPAAAGPEARAGAALFPLSMGDVAEWLLRIVYYRERNWFAEHGAYTADMAALGLERAPSLASGLAPGAPPAWPPAVAVTPGGFEATLVVPGGRRFVIRTDGEIR